MEALWAVISDDECTSPEDSTTPIEQLLFAMSKAAASGSSSSARTVLFQGSVQGIPVRILLDSGSSTSFISESLARKLVSLYWEPIACSVQVAGGGILKSAAMVRQLCWSIGDCHFQSDFRVLDLSSFDMVIGMDWLVRFSPMQIHWQEQWISIPYQGQQYTLHGIGAVVAPHRTSRGHQSSS